MSLFVQFINTPLHIATRTIHQHNHPALSYIQLLNRRQRKKPITPPPYTRCASTNGQFTNVATVPISTMSAIRLVRCLITDKTSQGIHVHAVEGMIRGPMGIDRWS